MIKSVHIHRFRGIEEGKLEQFSPLTILVGRNGSGKTSCLEALLLAASRDTEASMEVLRNRSSGIGMTGFDFLFGEGGASFEIETATGNSDHHFGCEARTGGPNVTFENTEERTVELEWSVPPGREGQLVLRRTLSFSESTTGDRAGPERWSSDGRENAEMMLERVRFIPPVQSAKMQTAEFRAVEKLGYDRIRALVSVLQKVWPDLADIRFTVLQDRMQNRQERTGIIVMYEGRGSVPLAVEGEGIRRAYSVAFQLSAVDRGVALIEEPEVFQHPRSMRLMARLIWASIQRGTQVILTTHSLEFIDELLDQASSEGHDLDLMSVFRVRLEKGRFGGIRIGGKDVSRTRSLIDGDLRQ